MISSEAGTSKDNCGSIQKTYGKEMISCEAGKSKDNCGSIQKTHGKSKHVIVFEYIYSKLYITIYSLIISVEASQEKFCEWDETI